MLKIQKFTFNPFQENTYVLYDDTKECIIIDPGMYTDAEKNEIKNFISKESLIPVRLINTHCHLDHIFGNAFISNTYDIGLEIHKGELPVLAYGPTSSQLYGVELEPSPDPSGFLEEGEALSFGNQILKIIFTPGHSPASISFYHPSSKSLISGDVLFFESIGRTDLPGGDFDLLIKNIRNKLFPLGDDVKVHPGHGPSTTIGYEKSNNPFL